ncbi:DUF1361 domain-containing protein [Dyadobacter luteus]|jgi:uncharacterized membrane protein|uniref:DUF1361 domain-containing protein n=1 Tax=Dyadobacter luteus TaxID=2259619 RepID=UPI001E2897F0|nr:DUF1361 domain-containing protein [Dyadobacter luteus]
MITTTLLGYFKKNQKIALVAFISFVSIVLLSVRIVATQHLDFIFLTWNLFLAWVPLLFMKWVWEKEMVNPTPFGLLALYFIVWLLFFPNAPYIITDLKHLRGVPEEMLWFDSLLIFLFAVSGFLAGLYSVRVMHRIAVKRWNAQAAWTIITLSMILSGFGVFLGRFGRWNSWDILTQPGALLRGIMGSLQDPLAIKHTVAFSFVLMLLYFAFHFFAELKNYESTRRYS